MAITDSPLKPPDWIDVYSNPKYQGLPPDEQVRIQDAYWRRMRAYHPQLAELGPKRDKMLKRRFFKRETPPIRALQGQPGFKPPERAPGLGPKTIAKIKQLEKTDPFLHSRAKLGIAEAEYDAGLAESYGAYARSAATGLSLTMALPAAGERLTRGVGGFLTGVTLEPLGGLIGNLGDMGVPGLSSDNAISRAADYASRSYSTPGALEKLWDDTTQYAINDAYAAGKPVEAVSLAIITGGARVAADIITLRKLTGAVAVPGLVAKGIRSADAVNEALAANAVKMAISRYVTSPGTPEERLRVAAISGVASITPLASQYARVAPNATGSLGRASNRASVIAADLIANIGVSLAPGLIPGDQGVYQAAWKQAEQEAIAMGEPGKALKYLAKTPFFQTAIMDLVASLWTKPSYDVAVMGQKVADQLIADGRATGDHNKIRLGQRLQRENKKIPAIIAAYEKEIANIARIENELAESGPIKRKLHQALGIKLSQIMHLRGAQKLETMRAKGVWEPTDKNIADGDKLYRNIQDTYKTTVITSDEAKAYAKKYSRGALIQAMQKAVDTKDVDQGILLSLILKHKDPWQRPVGKGPELLGKLRGLVALRKLYAEQMDLATSLLADPNTEPTHRAYYVASLKEMANEQIKTKKALNSLYKRIGIKETVLDGIDIVKQQADRINSSADLRETGEVLAALTGIKPPPGLVWTAWPQDELPLNLTGGKPSVGLAETSAFFIDGGVYRLHVAIGDRDRPYSTDYVIDTIIHELYHFSPEQVLALSFSGTKGMGDYEYVGHWENYKEYDARIKRLQHAVMTTIAVKPLSPEDRATVESVVTGDVAQQIAQIKSLPARKAKVISLFRQSIAKLERARGLRQKDKKTPELLAVYSNATGRSGIKSITQLTPQELGPVYRAVANAVPVKVNGQEVMTPTTGRFIDSLFTRLLHDGVSKEAAVDLIQQAGLDEYPGFRSIDKFTKQADAKRLIQLVLDQYSGLVREAKTSKNIDNAGESLASEYNNEASHIKGKAAGFRRGYVEGIEGKSPAEREALKHRPAQFTKDMRYVMGDIDEHTGVKVSDNWEEAVEGSNEVSAQIEKYRLSLDKEFPMLGEMLDDWKSGQRIAKQIHSNLKSKGAPKPDPNITPEEVAIANRIMKEMKGDENMARFIRFRDANYKTAGDAKKMAEDIPNAPIEDLNEALDIFYSQGPGAAKAYLDTRDWGVIRPKDEGMIGAYLPTSGKVPIVHLLATKLHLKKGKLFYGPHLKPRQGPPGVDNQDVHPVRMAMMYKIQLLNKLYVEPHTRALLSRLDQASPLIKNYHGEEGFRAQIQHNIDLLNGVGLQGGRAFEAMRKAYSLVAPVIFSRLGFGTRNIIQNLMSHPERRKAFNPRYLKKLDEPTTEWFNTHALQRTPIKFYMTMANRPLLGPGAPKLVRAIAAPVEIGRKIANYISLLPITDDYTRIQSFRSHYNVSKASAAKNMPDGVQVATKAGLKKFLNDSGLFRLVPTQRLRALRILANDGVEEAIRYMAKEHTADQNFYYDPAQRSLAEQTPVGNIVFNLAVFPRSYAMQLAKKFKQIGDKSLSVGRRVVIAKDIASTMAIGWMAGWAYSQVTGSRNNPYNPVEILMWQPGGLMFGVSNDVGALLYDTMDLLQGDRTKADGVIKGITRLADIGIPFYKMGVDTLESVMGKKQIDRLLLRRIREATDRQYRVNDRYYDQDRSTLEAIQHAVFGSYTEGDEKDTRGLRQPRQPRRRQD